MHWETLDEARRQAGTTAEKAGTKGRSAPPVFVREAVVAQGLKRQPEAGATTSRVADLDGLRSRAQELHHRAKRHSEQRAVGIAAAGPDREHTLNRWRRIRIDGPRLIADADYWMAMENIALD